MKKIGFSHGTLYKVAEKYLESTINIYKNCSSDVIEIYINSLSEVDKLNNIKNIVKTFAYKSIHLSSDIIYKNDEKSKQLLNIISDYYKEINADLILVHPDVVEDWEVFDQYKLNWAIENMDKEKQKFKTAKELIEFFKLKPNWKLVLDLNHCFSNDETMKLADDIITNLGDKIAEIHLSGYTDLHDPIFKTKQNLILDYCNKINAPIVIESVFESTDEVATEFNYIKEYLK